MAHHRNLIMPVAAALGALASTAPTTEANTAVSPNNSAVAQPTAAAAPAGQPNTFVSTGKDLLSFTVNERADGTVVAQHVSHASHASQSLSENIRRDYK